LSVEGGRREERRKRITKKTLIRRFE